MLRIRVLTLTTQNPHTSHFVPGGFFLNISFSWQKPIWFWKLKNWNKMKPLTLLLINVERIFLCYGTAKTCIHWFGLRLLSLFVLLHWDRHVHGFLNNQKFWSSNFFLFGEPWLTGQAQKIWFAIHPWLFYGVWFGGRGWGVRRDPPFSQPVYSTGWGPWDQVNCLVSFTLLYR